MDKKYIEETTSLIDFIRKSPSQFHVVANMRKLLEDAGFISLSENKRFNLERGKSYYITRNNSSLIAFRIPNSFDGMNIVAAHTDSPSFRIKANPDVKTNGCPTRLNIEGYGGMLLSTWLDRPLSIAGRVFVKENDDISERLVDLGYGCVEIANLAIHQNRDANNGYMYSIQKELLPIFADSDCTKDFDTILSDKLSCNKDDILSYDLFLYNATEPQIWGVDNAFFSSSKIDDLECAYTALTGLIESKPSTKLSMCALFDNEEVGSNTKQGAMSTLLQDVLKRINLNLNKTDEEYYQAIAKSMMVSCDNAHAVHPNHVEKTDAVNCTYMNKGIVIKESANQKYTTDAFSRAAFTSICQLAHVPYQNFANRSDSMGGSTLGNLSNTQVSMHCVDIGLPQLAMHSSYETAGIKDTGYAIIALSKFYQSNVSILETEKIDIEE